MRVLKIPVKGLMDVARVKAEDLVDPNSQTGIEVKGNVILVDTNRMMPPPRNTGKVRSVHLTPNGELVEEYGNPQMQANDTHGPRNFLRLRGGTIRFGKLTMEKTDLTLIDSAPGDWFGFDLEKYQQQLTAGNMRVTSTGGLEVFLPDIGKLRGSASR